MHKRVKIVLISVAAVLALLSIFQLVFSAPSENSLSLSELSLHEFESFLQVHGKSYSPTEYQSRFKTFQANLSYIHVFNSLDNTWKLGVNFFADLTYEEYKSTYLPKSFPLKTSEFSSMSEVNYPATVDWRTKGAVTPIKNQLACGGCYAFSAVSSIESAWFLAGHPLTSFSEQAIIDCSSIYGNDHCYGGLVDHAFEYAKAVGIPTEDTYPYNSANEKCNTTLASKVAVKITGYTDVPPNNSTALLMAIAQQPISVGVEADQMSWSFYKTGVITKDCGTNIDHAVVIEGYDTTQTIPYYIVRNSWGPKWGMAGYVLIEIKQGPGMCGIQQLPSYPYF